MQIVAGHRIDVTLIDFDMPGKNGVELARDLRELHPSTPIALVTAKVLDDVQAGAKRVGAVFIAKPLTEDSLKGFFLASAQPRYLKNCFAPTDKVIRMKNSAPDNESVTRDQLADLLNEDLAREYQAIIAYTVYSQVLKGAAYMSIAEQLETHAHEELKHALIISRLVDYLGKMPTATPRPVKTSDDAKTMLRFDLDNENETIINYRKRVRQCETLGEYAMAEQIRQILIDEQDHQIDLATALGEDVPDLTGH